MLTHQPMQPFFQNMGIDLRCGNIGMTQKLLYRAQIRAILQKMAGEGMAHHMGRDLGRCNARTGRKTF